jgi:SET domain-containing protein
MYLIKTYLDKSAIQGVGVFAGEDIPKGTVVWRTVEGFDQILEPDHVKKLPAAAQKYIARYAFVYKGKFYLCGDHGQFTNHSENPNTGNWPDKDSIEEVALRDIKKGEEITSDYRTFDESSLNGLGFDVAADKPAS